MKRLRIYEPQAPRNKENMTSRKRSHNKETSGNEPIEKKPLVSEDAMLEEVDVENSEKKVRMTPILGATSDVYMEVDPACSPISRDTSKEPYFSCEEEATYEKTDYCAKDIAASIEETNQEEIILDDTKSTEIKVNSSLGAKMEAHQIEGIIFMYNALFKEDKTFGEGCILAHCMGLGKTLQAIALVDTALEHPDLKVKKVLVLCPATLVSNWEKEYEKWLPEAGRNYRVSALNAKRKSNRDLRYWKSHGGVLVMNYQRFKALKKENLDPDILLCDEGHELKNNTTKLYQLLKKMRTKKRIILTGTPIQNNMKEFYNLVNFAKPGVLDSEATFNIKFRKPIERGMDKNSSPEAVQLMKERLSVLTNHLKKVMDRKDMSTLQPFLKLKKEFVLSVILNEDQKRQYNDHVWELNVKRNPLKDHKTVMPLWNQADGSKLKLLISIVKRCQESQEKLLVFTESLESLDAIERAFQKMSWQEGADYLRMDGTRMKVLADRQKAVDEFNNPANTNCKVFLVSSKTGSHGLNLTGASRVVIFDINWNPTTDVQAIFRAYRMGQRKPVFIYRLVAQGSFAILLSNYYLFDIIDFVTFPVILFQEPWRRRYTIDRSQRRRLLVDWLTSTR